MCFFALYSGFSGGKCKKKKNLYMIGQEAYRIKG